jgi:hypothetical protein
MRVAEILRESDDPFVQADIGTVLSMTSGGQFDRTITYVMKLSNGVWVTIALEGAEKGVERFSYVGAPVPLTDLHKAMQANRIGLIFKGLKRGEPISTSVQVNALPDGAVVVYPATQEECVKVGDHMERDGKTLPDWAFTRTNCLWLR